MAEIYPSSDTTFYASDAYGTPLVTDGTYQQILVPAKVEGRRFVIQVQATTMSAYDFDTDCSNFQWSSTGEAPGYLFYSIGKGCPTPKSPGGSLGFIKAPAGYNIVCASIA